MIEQLPVGIPTGGFMMQGSLLAILAGFIVYYFRPTKRRDKV